MMLNKINVATKKFALTKTLFFSKEAALRECLCAFAAK
jgi:hypothetical protein